MPKLSTVHSAEDYGDGVYLADVTLDFSGVGGDTAERVRYGVNRTDAAPICIAIREAIAAGGIEITAPAAVEETPAIPSKVTPLQLVRALRQLGAEAAFDAYLDANPIHKKDFLLSTEIYIDDPLVVDGAAALTQTTGIQIDRVAVFRLAKTK
jgi:hypothetical protein